MKGPDVKRFGATIRPPDRSLYRTRAVLASCVFHALLLGLLVGVLYRSERLPLTSGSTEAVPTMTLSKLVIVSTPLAPAPPVPKKKIPPVPPAPKPVPEIKPVVVKTLVHVPEEGVPVLTPAKTALAKSHPSHHAPAPAHAVKAAPAAKAPAASAMSASYAPGENVFPHPPYPEEARYLRETGTVVVNVQFDAAGRVTRVDVVGSSGVPLLDLQTRNFIRAHWHTMVYAGQLLRVPVQYTLEN